MRFLCRWSSWIQSMLWLDFSLSLEISNIHNLVGGWNTSHFLRDRVQIGKSKTFSFVIQRGLIQFWKKKMNEKKKLTSTGFAKSIWLTPKKIENLFELSLPPFFNEIFILLLLFLNFFWTPKIFQNISNQFQPCGPVVTNVVERHPLTEERWKAQKWGRSNKC